MPSTYNDPLGGVSPEDILMDTNWIIQSITYEPSLDGLTNVAQKIEWAATQSDEAGNRAGLCGEVTLAAPSPEAYTLFEDLDEAVTISWCLEALGEDAVNEIKASLDAEIARKASVTALRGLPWAEKANPTRGTGTPWSKPVAV